MLKTIFSRMFNVGFALGKVTVFLVGLAVVLGLTLAILAPVAEARVPALKKGVQNAVNSMTTLVGSLTAPILKLDNNGTGPALQLEVGSGNAPLVVNDEAGTATGLSADKLDGKEPDQLPGSIASTATIRGFPGIPFDLGGTGTPGEVIPWKFVGDPATGITTTSSQRLVGSAEVPLGDPTPTSFNYDLCYRPSGGSTITSFNGGPFQSAATLTSFDVAV